MKMYIQRMDARRLEEGWVNEKFLLNMNKLRKIFKVLWVLKGLKILEILIFLMSRKVMMF